MVIAVDQLNVIDLDKVRTEEPPQIVESGIKGGLRDSRG
jgi:hypothetical protein